MFRWILLFALALPALAGGSLLLSIGNPAATDDPAAEGALVTARVTACFGTMLSPAHWTVKAIGIVNGERVSIPVHSVPLEKDGLVAIHWMRPAYGEWQLRFTSHGYNIDIPVRDKAIRPQSLAMNGWSANHR